MQGEQRKLGVVCAHSSHAARRRLAPRGRLARGWLPAEARVGCIACHDLHGFAGVRSSSLTSSQQLDVNGLSAFPSCSSARRSCPSRRAIRSPRPFTRASRAISRRRCATPWSPAWDPDAHRCHRPPHVTCPRTHLPTPRDLAHRGIPSSPPSCAPPQGHPVERRQLQNQARPSRRWRGDPRCSSRCSPPSR